VVIAATPAPAPVDEIVPVAVRVTPATVVTVASAPPAVAPTLLAVDPPVAQGDPPLDRASRAGALTVIQREVAGCTACKLAQRRTQTVFARGNPEARLVFIGEGPGEQEDKQGLPFVGPAGQLLDKIIVAMHLDPDAVYVCNVVKCRPPGNRTPEPDEVAACTPFLLKQLGVVRPEVIVTLGRTATGFLLGSNAPMSRLRGQWHSYQGIPLLPTWHPSYLLREPAHKGETWSDMKLVMQRLGLTPPGARG
jgi:DNA polymerase